MQNNLKSVTFFREVFFAYFFAAACQYFHGISAGRHADTMLRAVLALTELNLRAIYYRPETQVFLVFFCIPFCSYTSLYLFYFCGISVDRYIETILRVVFAFSSRTVFYRPSIWLFVFLLFFCRPALYACGIFSPAILIC